MPPEDDVDYAEVRDTPSEGQGETSVAELAREGQTKTDDQQAQEKKQDDARRNYDTASSVDLPKISLGFEDGGLVATVGDKRVKLSPPEEGGLKVLEPGNGEPADLPKGLMDPGPIEDGGHRVRALEPGNGDLPTGLMDPGAIAGGGIRADIPLGELSPEQVAQINKAAQDGGLRAELPAGAQRPEGAPEARPEAKPEAKPEEGVMGRDGTGLDQSRRPAKVELDDQGRVTGYQLPDGKDLGVKYGADGKPNEVTVPTADGKPRTFTLDDKGKWVPQDGDKSGFGVTGVSVGDDGSVKITTDAGSQGTEYTIRKDGSYQESDLTYVHGNDGRNRVVIDKDGTTHTRDREAGTETVTKAGSNVSEVRDSGGQVKGYEVRDDQGHAQKIDKNSDGTVTVKEGGREVKYEKVEQTENGIKLTGKMESDGKGGFKKSDGSTHEISNNGTEIHRDKGGKVTEIRNSDGETTTFKRGPGGSAEATVTDGQGKVVETRKGVEVNDSDGSYKVKLSQAEADARKADGTEGKAETLERKADGTERLLAKDGSEVKSDADKLLEKFKNYSPEEQRQLRQDLADIDKLPKEQREKVYASLDKIARNDEHPGDKVKLTGDQARELVKSLAHQIAHPESIKQGENMTCTVASAEQTLARSHPEVYADMVSKLATEGQYTTADGKTIKAQGAENGKLDPKSDAYGQRSYTSELFQNGAVQLGLGDKQEYKAYGPGDPRALPRPEGVTAATDRGERVIDNSTNPPTVKDFTGFKAEKQAEILNHLVPGDKYGQTKPITTPAELEAALKQNGGPPLQVGINLEGAKDFSGMNRSEANHAVVITKIENGKVYYDNAAGGADHSYPHGEGVPIDKFVDSMKQGQMRAIAKGAGDTGSGGKMGAPGGEAGTMGAPGGDAGTMGAPNSKAQGDAPPVDKAKAAADAEKVFKAKDWLDDDEAAVYKALEGKNAQELKAMEEAFKKAHPDLNMSMEQYMMSFMDEGQEQAKVKQLLDQARAKDAGGDKPVEKPVEVPGNSPEDQKKCAEAKKGLETDIDSKVKNAGDREFMKQEIEKFEKRQPPVSAKERAEFYGQLDTLIKHQDQPGQRKDLPKEAERHKLALQVLEQANKPENVNQGEHTTCGTAAMESRLYTKNPAAVARAVTEVATTGKLTPQPQPEAGPAVEVHPSVLKPDKDAKTSLKESGSTDIRNYASQIFQGAATTLEREGYRQDAKINGKDTGDTGERYKEGSQERNFEGLTGKEVSSIEKKLTGVTDKDIEKDPSKAPQIIEGFDSGDTDVSGSQYPGRIAISKGNEAELNRKLQDLKKDGKLPVMIAVDTAEEPFKSDSAGRPPDGAGGKHFVTVTDIDENGNVTVDNQWGPTADHNGGQQGQKGKLPVSQLSKALGHS